MWLKTGAREDFGDGRFSSFPPLKLKSLDSGKGKMTKRNGRREDRVRVWDAILSRTGRGVMGERLGFSFFVIERERKIRD